MPVPIIETCRKRKRKPRVYNLQRFGEDGFPIHRNGTFRDQIRVFLRDGAEVEDYDLRGMPVWCTLFSHETKSSLIPLYIVEENVIHSPEPYCDHCRCTGWSNHFVSKRKYHFIIPNDSEWSLPLEEDAFDFQTHALHGLIHCNGFGHLLCVNGMEGGSKYLCGREIVDFWDRICNSLGARMITVEDLSKKRALELRLLYGVAYGHSWFGRWGYKFCRGSYGVSKSDYENAIELLGSLELDQIECDFSELRQFKVIKQVIRYYRDMSEGHLKTVRDLLRFMLIIKSHASPQKLLPATPPLLTDSPHQKRSNRLLLKKSDVADNDKSPKYRNYSSVAANLGSRWPVRRLIFAAEVIVESLKEMKALKPNGMTRQDVRDSARLHIGDTGLLDYVLKSMHNVVVGDVLVRRYVDPITRILHYTIQELDDAVKAIEPKKEEAVVLEEITPLRIFTPLKAGADVYGDLLLLYTNVLLNYPDSELVRSATQAILDSKHFVKEWPLWDDNNDKVLQFVCRINPSLIDLRSEQITELPPGDLVTVPLQATVFDLKQAIEDTFRDTYCILSNLVVSEIEEVKEDMSLTESCSALTVTGHGIDLESKLKCQGGCDTWMVKCICRARDDDGERMISCDVCEVWQHTRCCGIDDSDTLPPLFVCSNCCEEFAEQQRKVLQPKYEFPSSENMFLIESADDFFGDQRCLGMIFPEENYLL
ncbi:unnamed protein product [Arabidopsis lyrata]|uniref:Zinc finger PHD-type domain-containing protein n=1 Tax=Arabidopsis lyrata subsp. lyrata TaxID=81972 RepID=D7KTL0_ARALL|nr:PHD finger protein MALE MEIOCYTE DEATH 1 [Arabidopsis lyrata subsp. lyrata]EFH64743.1 hypothetical protein ARALYDRAFT_894251 [Arabidopsis lyrata subsp. lyrata]CAH8257143.1 unnamed protein product [Arabidopsis lyrata]|eukprot:XP_002888484.1 PHD finger protein MALE MEIOCYTE DEATH 1 [Arabidopsis lyrata subsp. lyrata]